MMLALADLVDVEIWVSRIRMTPSSPSSLRHTPFHNNIRGAGIGSGNLGKQILVQIPFGTLLLHGEGINIGDDLLQHLRSGDHKNGVVHIFEERGFLIVMQVLDKGSGYFCIAIQVIVKILPAY